MTTPKRLNAEDSHGFAWEGFSFRVPADWNLSAYTSHSKFSAVSMEDDHSVRLEMDWMRSSSRLDGNTVLKRYDTIARSMMEAGAEQIPIQDVSEGWSAFLYAMPSGKFLVTAFRMFSQERFFCFFRLHFESVSRREPPRILKLITSGFRLNDEESTVPWEVYDAAFRLSRDFRLVNTSFQAGRKFMVFEWRLRRLFIWHFSLADLILKERRMEEWGVAFLREFKGIRGPRFTAGQNGRILAERSRRYPIGHFEEILRMCFRYRACCARIESTNQLLLCVFQYRSEGDLPRPALTVDGVDLAALSGP